MKDKKRKQNATNNGTAYVYDEIALQTKSCNEVQTKFRTLFPEHLPANKTTTRKNTQKYERDGTSLNMKKDDQGEELPQEHKKTLKWCGNHWKEIRIRDHK